MASIRARSWTTPQGTIGRAFVVDYTDRDGRRRSRQFDRRRDAAEYRDRLIEELRAGTHIPDRESCTVAEACGLYLRRLRADEFARGTIDGHAGRIERHILPALGETRLNRLTPHRIQEFFDAAALGRDLARRVRDTLGAAIEEAQRRGLVAVNAVRAARPRRAPRRQEIKDEEAADLAIPSRAEVCAMIAAAEPLWLRAIILVLALEGLRIGEARALSWEQVDFKAGYLRVRQGADKWGAVGPVKTTAARRDVPLAPIVASALKEWRLACPKSKADLVFPTGAGTAHLLRNLQERHFYPLLKKLGLGRIEKIGDDGREKFIPRFTPHALRHFAASAWIDQGVSPKQLSSWIGHTSVAFTLDVYGHLFPKPADDAALIARVENWVMQQKAG